MVESDTPKKQRLQEQIDAQVARELEEQQEKKDMRMNEQIATDAEVVMIHAEEELQGMIDSLDRSNETIAKYLQEYQDFSSELPLEKRIELISDLVKYQENYSKFGSRLKTSFLWAQKKKLKRIKRKGLNLEQEHVKKQKTSEEDPEIKKSTKEISKEKMKEMMQLVPVEDVYVQSLQVKHPIIDWKPPSAFGCCATTIKGVCFARQQPQRGGGFLLYEHVPMNQTRLGLAAATIGNYCRFRISQVTYRKACLMLALEGFSSSL
nr:hypothetical protein [Tanacetum cinerariifolium]